MEQIGDLSLTATGPTNRIVIALPTGFSRSLTSAGYNRARLFVTDEGILLKPYTGEKGRKTDPELPKWSDE